MFTGIIEELGTVISIKRHPKGARFTIQANEVLNDTRVGDSISVNGCCLTIVNKTTHEWECDLVEETLNRTNFKDLKEGEKVNLERAVRFQDRINGHIVQGHIDGTGKIIDKDHLTDGSYWLSISASPNLLRYIVTKGSIALDGVSLTIADLKNDSFSIAIIPHTAQATTLGFKQIGGEVNIEVDLLAKYIERLGQKC